MRPMHVGAGKRGPSSDEGSLDQYLREISKYPLIPQEEEVTLAQRIRVGDRRRSTSWSAAISASSSRSPRSTRTRASPSPT